MDLKKEKRRRKRHKILTPKNPIDREMGLEEELINDPNIVRL